MQISLSDDERAEATRTLRIATKGVRLWGDEFTDCPEDACRFIFDHVETKEETTGAFMRIEDMSYLRDIASDFYEASLSGEMYMIHKSRRLIVSWFLTAIELYRAGFRSTGHGIVAETFEGLNGAKGFVGRVKVIYDRLAVNHPEWELLPCESHGSDIATEYTLLKLPNGSFFRALNANEGKVRGAGIGYIRLEELSVYPRVNEIVGQCKAILMAPPGYPSGMLCSVANASPNPEYIAMKEAEGFSYSRIIDPNVKITAKTGNLVRLLHYRCDPKKGDEWVALNRGRYSPAVWMREFELVETVYEGDPVHSWYEDEKHRPDFGLNSLFPIYQDEEGTKYFMGWDCSTSTVNYAAVLIQVLKAEAGWKVQFMHEFISGGATNVHSFSKYVKQELKANYPLLREWSIKHDGDPAGNARSGSDENSRTNFEIIRTYGFNISKALSQNPSERINVIDEMHSTVFEDGMQQVSISEKGCPFLTAAWRGAYCWAEFKNKSTGNVKSFKAPAKNGFSHVAEAAQYGALRAMAYIKSMSTEPRKQKGGSKFVEKATKRKRSN